MGEEKLICEIEKRPALWDQSQKEYSDRIRRKENWEEVTNIFADENSTFEEKKQLGELLHKKWKNIRDRYCRDLLNQRGKSGEGAKKKPPYVYSRQLMFLKDTVSQKETTDTLQEVNIESRSSAEIEEPTPTTSTATSSAKKRLLGKRRSNIIEEKLLSSLDMYEKRMSAESHNNDDNRQFLLSLAPTLASLPKILNTKCRIEIMQVISKYESWAAQPPQPQPVYHPHQFQQQQGCSPQPQQQQGYSSYAHQYTVQNPNQQKPTHSADRPQTSHKRSLTHHLQE